MPDAAAEISLFSMPPGEVLLKKRALLKKLSAGGGFTPVRIALLGGSTIGEIENILRLYLLAHGIEPSFRTGRFGRWYEEIVFGDEALAAFAPEIVYIHTTSRNLDPSRPEILYGKLEEAWEKLGVTVIQNNFEMLPYRVMGNRDCSHGVLRLISGLNGRMAARAEASDRFYINDIHWLSAWFGLERWFDDGAWYMYRYAVSLEAVPPLCENLAKIVKSLLGKNKKALALDLDDTLWGGVVGDVGAAALEQTEDTPKGEAFADFQKYLKAVSALGVPLNAVSKNDEANALAGLENAFLKRDDFLYFFANWENKDKNLRALAREMNIGEESIVFVDDNPAERELAKSFTNAAVLEVGAPEGYIRALDRMGYFEVTTVTGDDQRRLEDYRAGLARKKEEASFADYAGYLRSLRMTASFEPVGAQNARRVAQLINKTNQFNLTARRYMEAEVAALEGDPGVVTVCGRLADKFGDNGLVTALFASAGGGVATIDLWVMSCRVFKRGLEYAALGHLLKLLRERGIATVRGLYVPTGKNGPVENLYRDLGFNGEDGTVWTAALDEVALPEIYMEVSG